MLYRHLFWDFDGTLFDTYPRICRAFQKGLADAGLSVTADVIRPVIKRSLRDAAVHFAAQLKIDPQVLLDGYRRHSEEEGYDTMLPYPGMPGFLQAAHEKGVRHYLYTHRGESALKALEHYGLTGLFEDFVTSQDGFPAKPAPDALNWLIEKHMLDRARCAMIGDRTIDLEAGLNAGIAAICLDPDGLCPSGREQAHVRDYGALDAFLLKED